MSPWTTAEIPNLSGKTFVITGSNSGLGREAALAVGKAGATVILAVRTEEKAIPVATQIGANARIEKIDLANLTSVRDFASRVTEPIDVLINNAGIMAVPFSRSVDGFEMQMAANHFGHFALTGLLLPQITDRVVSVASHAHRIGRIDFKDINYTRRRYERWTAYGQSKLSNLLFGYELARKLTAAHSPVRSIVAHPGYSQSELHGHSESFQDTFMKLGSRLAQSTRNGALPEIFAATAPSAQHGAYYGPQNMFGTSGPPVRCSSTARSRDTTTAAQLWSLSTELTDVHYPLGK